MPDRYKGSYIESIYEWVRGFLLRDWIDSGALAIISFLIVLVACCYAVPMATLAQSSTADQFNSTYIASEWKPGGKIVVLAQHTNLIKLPVLWVQGNLRYGMRSWVILNLLFVLSAVLSWSLLIYLLTRQKAVLTISNLLFAALILGSTDFVIGLSMTTQMNLEYPLILLYLMVVTSKFEKFDKTWFLLSATILALLVASGYFFIYAISVATVLAATVLFFWQKINVNRWLITLSNVSLGTLGGVILLYFLEFAGPLKLLGKEGVSKFISYDVFWQQTQTILHQVLKLFGGDFFGLPLSKTTLLTLPMAALFISAIAVVIRYLKKDSLAKSSLYRNQYISFYIAVVALTVCLAYLFSGEATIGDANIRHLTIIPFIGVLLVATYITKEVRMEKRVIFILLAFFVFASSMLRIRKTQAVYSSKRADTIAWVNIDKAIVSYLKSNDIKIAYGTIGYSATTWFYSNKKVDVYNIIPCNKTYPPLSYSGWYTPKKPQKTALIIDRSFPSYAKGESWYPCSDEAIARIYGQPIKRESIGSIDSKPIEVWTYGHDINANMTAF